MNILKLFTVFLLATALAACTTNSVPRHMRDEKVPFGGGKLPEATWVAASDHTTTHSLEMEKTFFWLVPFNIWHSELDFAGETVDGNYLAGTELTRAVGHTTRWNDLLGPLFLTTLPVRVFHNEYFYERGNERPVSRRGFAYTPFYTWSWEKGQPINDGVSFKTAGVPLVYGYMRGLFEDSDGTTVRIRVHQMLWTLGPMLARLNVESDEGRVRGWMSTPLFLGGALGMTLWSNYSFLGQGNDDVSPSIVTGHGPLFGVLGFLQVKSRYITRVREGRERHIPREVMRLVLAGILWTDKIERNPEGTTTNAVHGPLWGMFGWGKKDERFALRVFWVPIKF